MVESRSVIKMADGYRVSTAVKDELKNILKNKGFKLEYVTRLNPFEEDKHLLVVVCYMTNANKADEYTVCGYNSNTKEFCNVFGQLTLPMALQKAVMWMRNQV